MKHFVAIACAACFVVSSFAQPGNNLLINTQKTTSLIFPCAIKHVDRGSKDVLVEPVKEADNILLVKAASSGFAETNLSIVTDDGSVYSFSVCYGEPAAWVYRLPTQLKTSISTYANSILDNPQIFKGSKDASGDMSARIAGIYIKDNVLYYQLRLANLSSIDYDIDFLRFYIRDKKKVKRTALQENELTSLYAAGNTSQVKANSRGVVVVAFEKFTVPATSCLMIEIGEKNGGRNLSVRVNNHSIIKAVSLPDLR